MPADVTDPVLGPLRWDAKLSWWVGTADLAGHAVEFFVSYEPSDEQPDFTPEAALATAGRVFTRLREREAEYRGWSAEEFDAYRWNEEEDMTPDDIFALLKPASVTLFPSDGSVNIYWDDDDRLFAGHNLITDITPAGACEGTRMEG